MTIAQATSIFRREVRLMKKLVSLTLAMAISLTPVLSWTGVGTTPAAAQAPSRGALSIPLTTATGPATLTITRFALQDGKIVAVGTVTGFTGITTDANSNTNATTVTAPVVLDLIDITVDPQCEILHLELGPLDLNLLGLMIHLDKVVLDITAQSGPGNLLGNLLCAIAGLLDPPSPLAQLVAALNQLLGLLGNL
jgi:hypothetical protein